MLVYLSTSTALESIGASILMLIVLLVLSSPLIYAGWKNKSRFDKLSSVNSKWESSSEGEPIAMSGRIKSSSERIESPFNAKICSLAVWDISTLKRRGTLGAGFVWSQEAVGIDGNELVIETDNRDINVDRISSEKVLDSGEKLKHSLMADSTSKFSCVEIELDDESFEDRTKPTGVNSNRYENFESDIKFERPERDDYSSIGKILAKLRTPEYTTRYREKTFEKGDKISVIGKRTSDGISFVSSESTSPLISSSSISDILLKYRMSYTFQLYFIPTFCILVSATLGYSSYI